MFRDKILTEAGILDYFLTKQQFIRMKVGTYTGDTAATKAITGIGFTPKFVIIYAQVTEKAIGMKSNLDTTYAFIMGMEDHAEYLADQIISLDTNGFTVGDGTGTHNDLNANQAYVYVAWG